MGNKIGAYIDPTGRWRQPNSTERRSAKGANVNLLQELKLFDKTHNRDMSELVLLHAGANQLVNEFEVLELEAPQELLDQRDAVRKAIDEQAEASLRRELAEVEAQEQALLTNSERRARLQNRRANLEKKLGIKKRASA